MFLLSAAEHLRIKQPLMEGLVFTRSRTAKRQGSRTMPAMPLGSSPLLFWLPRPTSMLFAPASHLQRFRWPYLAISFSCLRELPFRGNTGATAPP